MKFSKLTDYFEKMEATAKRLELVVLLAEVFKEAEADEIANICYLMQGRIVPFYDPLELGMAEKNVAAAIAEAYGVEKDKVLADYRRLGDLGEVAEKIRGKGEGVRGKELKVNDVHTALVEIAKTSGAGSQDKKLQAFCDLLRSVDAVSAKHLCRIPLGRSRLGIGDPTVLDALSVAKTGAKDERKALEAAYSKTSDLGHVAETYWKHGLSAVEKLDLVVGKPIRAELTERIPDPKKVIEKMGPVNAQPKYDGFRVQIHVNKHKTIGVMKIDGEVVETKVKLFSRNLEDMTHMFPELREAALEHLHADSAILDSEALAYNPDTNEFYPFQETTKRRRKHGIEEAAESLPLKAFVFDLMYLNGTSYIDKPQKDRIAKIKEVITHDHTLMPAPGEYVDNPERLLEMFNEAITDGLEGLVVKRPDSLYEAGARNFNWVKIKRQADGDLNDTIDCVILGYIAGKGKRADFGAGALLVGVYNAEEDTFETISKIGTGLTDDEWREIHKRCDALKLNHKPARVNSLIEPTQWVQPEIVIEVFADEITRSPRHTAGASTSAQGGSSSGRSFASDDKEKNLGYALRFPRLLKFRGADKTAEDATTVAEIKKMFENQYKKSKG